MWKLEEYLNITSLRNGNENKDVCVNYWGISLPRGVIVGC